MKAIDTLILVMAILLLFSQAATAQTGGNLDLSHSVIVGGGDSRSTNGPLTIDGTIGQPQAGTVSTGGTFDLRGGFWAYQTLLPTAAPVSIAGRVVGTGIQMTRVRIVLVELDNGLVRGARPNPFGYYHFDDLHVGAYLIRAQSANYRFTPSEIFVNLVAEFAGIDFLVESP